MSFEKKTAVITGGASGLGLLTGQDLAEEGCNVVLVDVNAEAVAAKAAEITEKGKGKAIGIACDVRDYEQVAAARDKAVEEFGSIDYLVCCAGGAECRIKGIGGEFFDIPIDVYDWGLDVNLKGALYFNHAVMKQMAQQKSGAIVNLGSVSGMEGAGPNLSYASSKAGIIGGLTPTVAMTGARYNVRCNTVTPGPVLTRLPMAGMTTMMSRAADPQEVVNVILFLLSDKASFVTGANYVVDGGRLLTLDKRGGLNEQYKEFKEKGLL